MIRKLPIKKVGRAITLNPLCETSPLQKEHGFWVYRTGRPLKGLSIRNGIDKNRRKRDQRVAE